MDGAQILEWMADRVGGLENLHPSSTMAKVFKHGGPSKTREFRRIHAIPRRRWEEDPQLDELVRRLSAFLRAPGGTAKLWRVQAAALRDLFDYRGLFAPIAVGRGKAWISVLAAELLQAERPLLIVPAALREQTRDFVIPEMREHWRLPENLKTITYWDLSQATNARALEEYGPDLIIADEVHRLKNKDAGRTKRVARYMKEHPETIFVALSGTVTNRSIKDYAHILRWCFGERAPLPESWHELGQWADVLDVLPEDQEDSRSPPGALKEWATDGKSVRQGYRDRLVETPGVIATQETELGVSLRILSRSPKVPEKVELMMAKMEATWETPNGDLITEPIDLWRHMRELACGFFYRWDPAAPREWLDPRKVWKRYVRDTLKHNRRQLDTELQVWNELAQKHGMLRPPRDCDLDEQAKEWLATWRAGLDPNHCFWCEWECVKHTFKINKVPEWVDDFAIDDCTRWLHEVGGVVWTEHTDWGKRLAEVSGCCYFGSGKKANKEILTHEGPMIASIKAHGEGKNLQKHHHRGLIATPPSSGKTWEQLLGRKHRDGQREDAVVYEVYRHAQRLCDSIKRAYRDAIYLDHTTTRQKMLYADYDFEVKG
jgi:hypothetical protein